MEAEKTEPTSESENKPPETHNLRTIQDLINVATDENIDNLLIDLRNHIQLFRHHETVVGFPVTQANAGSEFEWLDTGKHNLYINLSNNEWASKLAVGRIITSRPALFGNANIIYLINDTGGTLIMDPNGDWLTVVAQFMSHASDNV